MIGQLAILSHNQRLEIRPGSVDAHEMLTRCITVGDKYCLAEQVDFVAQNHCEFGQGRVSRNRLRDGAVALAVNGGGWCVELDDFGGTTRGDKCRCKCHHRCERHDLGTKQTLRNHDVLLRDEQSRADKRIEGRGMIGGVVHDELCCAVAVFDKRAFATGRDVL